MRSERPLRQAKLSRHWSKIKETWQTKDDVVAGPGDPPGRHAFSVAEKHNYGVVVAISVPHES
jgi:hypothetical protein